ncbi:putative kinetochore protein NUF2 [Spathaspora sp. JA1]|nr:putative kinetochore protein NUF2 [Spathaspora sp. JA1]
MVPARRSIRASQSRRRSTINSSSQISSSQQSSQQRSQPSVQQQPQVRDLFPLFPIKEIAGSLSFCGFEVNEDLIKKPTAAFVFQLYEQFLEQCLSIPVGRVESVARRLLLPSEDEIGTSKEENENGSQDPDRILSEVEEMEMTMNRYMVLCKFCRSFFADLGFYDFGLFDIAKPDPIRTHRILSAVLNYLRYREEVSPQFEEMAREVESRLNELESSKTEYESFLKIKQDLQSKYGKTDEARHEKLRAQNAYNSRLEGDVERLRESLQNLEDEYNEYEQKKLKLKKRFEDVHRLVEGEHSKLKMLQEVKSTDVKLLQELVADSQSKTVAREQEIKQLKQHHQNYGTTLSSIESVESELQELLHSSQGIKNTDDQIQQLKSEIKTIEDTIRKLTPRNENLEDEVNNLESKFIAANEKFGKLNDEYEARFREADAKLKTKQIEYNEGIEEINKILDSCRQLKVNHSELEHESSRLIEEFEIEQRDTKVKFGEVEKKFETYIHIVDPILNL